MSEQLRQQVKDGLKAQPGTRLTRVLCAVGLAASSWYRKPAAAGEPRQPGPKRKTVPSEVVTAVVSMAIANPWYGYKRIAVMCRRAGQVVTDRQTYRVMKDNGLLHKRRPVAAELYQSAKLFELLPQQPDELWQMDVTYVHVPGYGWWYVVTVIDYYSRYLLAAHFTSSYCAFEVTLALQQARCEAERVHGPLTKPPFLVTDNGSSFIARKFVRHVAEGYSHVRIRYRTPTQLGLLERFHQTLKQEEVHWRLYESPADARACIGQFRDRYNQQRPHWALVPEVGGDPLTPQDVYVSGCRIAIPKWQGWARAAKAKLDEVLGQTAERMAS